MHLIKSLAFVLLWLFVFESSFTHALCLEQRGFLLFVADLSKNTSFFISLPARTVFVLVLFVAHDAIELLISQLLAALFANSLLEFLNVLEVLSFFGVFGPHLVVLECFVQLLVFLLGLALFECLDLCLLHEQPLFDISHVAITLQHFSQEIVWTRNRHFGLN